MEHNPKKYASVVMNLPVEGFFTYEVPSGLEDSICIGMRVLAPFGRRMVTGYVVALEKESPVKGIKRLLDVLDDSPLFDAKRLKFFQWLASYYFAPLGEVFSLAHPSEADVKSQRRFRITEKGREFLGSAKPSHSKSLTIEVLSSAGDFISLPSLIKKLKKRSLYSTIFLLKKDGLIEEDVFLKGGKTRLENFVSLRRAEEVSRDGLIDKENSLISFLEKNNETPLASLKKELGNVDAAIKKLLKRGLINVVKKEKARNPLKDLSPRLYDFAPNKEQECAIDEIGQGMGKGFSPYLLYGVTGSGKTLVYLKLIEKAVESGKKAMYLLPEIALTERPLSYLLSRFPGRVRVLHSGLTGAERYEEWKKILKGEFDVIVGARSSLFSPAGGIGLIIVDEEHDPSYKQEEGVRYNARDAALMLGKILDIPVVLGSATPSIETFHNARTGKITPIYLKKRVNEITMPGVEILDMKKNKGEVISGRLISAIKETVERGEQAMLFLNRRGFSRLLTCRDCGSTITCVNCSVSLTLHKGENILKCHYCGHGVPIPDVCPKCGGYNLKDPGVGTEKVEEEVRRLFPGIRTARLDRDVASKKGAAAKVFESVEKREVDVLIGTQMIAKGHHFPGITLVGIISGDTSLNMPDFRSAERTFQIVSQASGRAGRETHGARVIIQTVNPEHFCFQKAAEHDYEGFFEEEFKAREDAGYPPCLRLAGIRLEGIKEESVERASRQAAAVIQRLAAGARGIS
ncbi:MAG: primosomal protein N', partial [Thermodesulfobacteriota bacterium]